MDKIKLIKALLSDEEPKQTISDNSIKIAILQRGWVVIGRYSECGEDVVLTNAYVIRRWGTSNGLGQLALKGKQSETKLEKTGVVRFNKLTSVGLIDCVLKIWDKELT